MEGLGTLLRRLLDELDGAVQSQYDAIGVAFRPRFYPVARRLLEHDELSIRAIATAVGVSHSAMSQTVAEMQRAGLVRLVRGDDARERLVQLTVEGRARCARLAPLWNSVAQAAAELDAELPMPLGAMLEAAIGRLEAESFALRIARHVDEAAVR